LSFPIKPLEIVLFTLHYRQIQAKNLTKKSESAKKKEFKEINKQTELAGESNCMAEDGIKRNSSRILPKSTALSRAKSKRLNFKERPWFREMLENPFKEKIEQNLLNIKINMQIAVENRI
jgi:hypothetical protein